MDFSTKSLRPALLVLCLPLASCYSAHNSDVPNYTPPPITFNLGSPSPGGSPECQCTNSQSVTAVNSDSRTQQFQYTIQVRDTSSGKWLKPVDSSKVLPGGQSTFMGCTIYDPATSCRFQAIYQLGAISVVTQNSGREAAIFGPFSAPSISSCATWCSDATNPKANSCLHLGVRYYQAVAPITKLVAAAQGDSGTIKKADLLKAYNIKESDDSCHRGDVSITKGLMTNDGDSEACMLKSADLPKELLHSLGIAADPREPTSMIATLPRKVEAVGGAEGGGDLHNFVGNSVITFPRLETTPVITFAGAGGAKLTSGFGGTVIGASRIAPQDQPKQTVIATSNACMSVDEPN